MRLPAPFAAALMALVWAIMPGAAAAASFDCGRATTPIERRICADPGLSAADSQLGQDFDAALTLSLDPAGLRASQTEWLTQSRDKAAANDELAEAYARRQKELDKMLAQLRATEAGRTIGAAEARANCLPILAIPDAGACKVTAAEEMGAVEGHAFAYASYEYAKGEEEPDYRRVVIFECLASAMSHAVIAPDADAAFYYDKPRLLHAGRRTMLQIPAYESGTGNFNRERLFVWRDGRWRDVDITSWEGELARRLPAGEGVWQGIFPDYVALKASTPVWRKDDGNACPSGGRADLGLGWRGDRIALETIRLRKAGECGEPLRPGRGDN
ncbi:lysozyme inhibitor LprI family protein [Methylocapsa sp. S129]|uniref:lysozyme inhibitor LprI family protein n=1 Tax=Methylocapsa sp. S129 TaxID=1641869 RepID=UPI00131C7F46|nr:hypothetical protein [Methylocapsa sp. S129]